MTQDQLTQGEALLISINSLTLLSNQLDGSIQTALKGQVPGVDPLLATASSLGLIDGPSFAQYLSQIQDAANASRKDYQAKFDAL